MGRLHITSAILTCACLVLGPATAAACAPQGQQGQSQQDTTATQAPPPVIAQAAIPQRVEQASSALRALQDRLGRTDAFAAIADALPAFVDSLNTALENPAFRPGDGASMRTLDGIRRRWTPFQERLDAWKGTLDQRSEQLATERDSLLRRLDQWERTQTAAREASAPAALLEQTSSLLGQIRDTDSRLRARLDTVLSVLDQVNRGRADVQNVVSQVDSAEAAARGRLLALDSPPLWQAVFAPQDTLSLVGQLSASWDEAREGWDRYVSTSSNQLGVVVGVFLLLLSALLALGHRSKGWGESRQWPVSSEALEETIRILSRPVSTAFLLTVLVWRLAYGVAPTSIGAVVMIVLVVPVLRLLPASRARTLREPLLGLAAIWVLNALVALALDGSLLQRLGLLVTAALAGGGLYWATRQGSPVREFGTSRWWRAVIALGRLGLVVMVASVLANLFGFVSLAEMLTRATLQSAAVGLVLATVATIVDGLVWTLLHTDWARSLNVIRNHSDRLTSRLMVVAHLAALLLWADIALRQFGIERPVTTGILGVLSADLTLGSFTISLGDILAFVVVIWLSLVLARAIRSLLEEDVLQRVTLPRGVPTAISTMVHYAGVFVGFLLAAAAAGFDLSRFTLLAGAFGVGLGFGLQSVVNNFVSGLILIFERPIQVGDVVDVGGVQGRVKRIGIRASTVRTWSGAEVIVPNGDLISQQVTNWTLSDQLRRMEVAIGVKYGTDPQRVIDLLTEAINQHPDVITDPPAYVIFKGFGDSSLDFEVRAWTASNDWWVVNSDLAVTVNNVLKEAGIEIPFPQRDLHLRSVAPDVKLGG